MRRSKKQGLYAVFVTAADPTSDACIGYSANLILNTLPLQGCGRPAGAGIVVESVSGRYVHDAHERKFDGDLRGPWPAPGD